MSRLFGWGVEEDGLTIQGRHDVEKRKIEELYNDMPILFAKREEPLISPVMKEKWEAFQSSKGRFSGSNSLTLLQEFVLGTDYDWLPQIIGSCVLSNGFRPWVTRALYQNALRGDGREYLGTQEFSPRSIAFYAPFTYGEARRRANLRGGDGLYCGPLFESLSKTGVLPCSTPALLELLTKLRVASDRDLPEPQNAGVYRSFGNWNYIDDLKKYCDFRLLQTDVVTDVDQLIKHIRDEFKTACVCSGVAIKKAGTHKDGFNFHVQDTSDTWPHNMSLEGIRIASDGNLFVEWGNESWGPKVFYNMPYQETKRLFDRKLLTVQTFGEIDLPRSVPEV